MTNQKPTEPKTYYNVMYTFRNSSKKRGRLLKMTRCHLGIILIKCTELYAHTTEPSGLNSIIHWINVLRLALELKTPNKTESGKSSMSTRDYTQHAMKLEILRLQCCYIQDTVIHDHNVKNTVVYQDTCVYSQVWHHYRVWMRMSEMCRVERHNIIVTIQKRT